MMNDPKAQPGTKLQLVEVPPDAWDQLWRWLTSPPEERSGIQAMKKQKGGDNPPSAR